MDFNFSASYLISSLLISCLGMGLFLYGKKAQRLWPLLGGLVMCVYPFFISGMLMMWGLTAVICAGLYFLRDR
jgi:hypothetical protein